MLDRMLLWEMSQIRRHELLELAAAVRPGRRSLLVKPVVRATRAALTIATRVGARLMAQEWSRNVASESDAARPAASLH
jgi:hypothetical protein